ncbi:peptide ABC transporter permease [Staphylococcus americanisciuri]|uniref:Peptide ABC transporter permease n=1 Tax=Staphylococcus americanisciuri TaxID=2973940 RepID=A0ABT2F0C6_9STAP|nr:peptide ABC transporter permease [Staphylococcus americanisciuri]MCS4485593.1 peptide ABC transporter permease [Staphylococcus americanisciuri]
MNLEFKKSLSNKIVLSLVVLFLFLFLLGYFLPIGIDKVAHLSYGQYFFSAYTVATEFGFLLFSFVIAYFINKEYSNKNTLFYKLIGNNVFSFFYKKVILLFIESFVCVLFFVTIVSLIYGDFSHYFMLVILFSLVILQYIIIIGTVSIVSPNVLISIGISIVYWISSIVLVAVNKHVFGILAPFEASNSLYKSVDQVLSNQATAIDTHDIKTIVAFFILAFIVNLIVLSLSKKRWLKLGM